jgi:hypothetical protein
MADQDENSVVYELREIRNSLSTLDSKIGDVKQSLQSEIHSIRSEILQFQLKAQQLDDISEWSTRFREKITLTDIERMRDDISNLKEFKAKAAVSFAMAQFVMAAVVAWFTKG